MDCISYKLVMTCSDCGKIAEAPTTDRGVCSSDEVLIDNAGWTRVWSPERRKITALYCKDGCAANYESAVKKRDDAIKMARAEFDTRFEAENTE